MRFEHRFEDIVGCRDEGHRNDEESRHEQDVHQPRAVGVDRHDRQRSERHGQQAAVDVHRAGGDESHERREDDGRERQRGEVDDARTPSAVHHRLRRHADQDQQHQQRHGRQQERNDEERSDEQNRDAEPLVESFAVEDEEECTQHDARTGVVLQNGEQHRDTDDHTHAQQIAEAVDREGVVAHHARQCQRRGDLDEFDGLDAQRPQFDP